MRTSTCALNASKHHKSMSKCNPHKDQVKNRLISQALADQLAVFVSCSSLIRAVFPNSIQMNSKKCGFWNTHTKYKHTSHNWLHQHQNMMFLCNSRLRIANEKGRTPFWKQQSWSISLVPIQKWVSSSCFAWTLITVSFHGSHLLLNFRVVLMQS